MLHLARLNQVLHRSRYVLNGHIEIDAVLIEEVDGVDLQALERILRNLLDAFGPAVEPLPARTFHRG